VLILYTDRLDKDHELVENFKRKLAPSLVTLISSPPEIQYIVLRNMHLILQKYPDILAQGIRVFFCKYNDPLYIKLEKLKLIILMASDDNVEQIYPELSDYAKEVDMDFVRKAIRAFGDVVLQVPNSVKMALEHLLELAKNDVNYVVQELVVTLRDILRSFPGSYDVVIPMLCKSLDSYDDPESRAAYVWLLGEYYQSFENIPEIVAELLDNFKLEAFAVQSELFSSLLKLYLADPLKWRDSVQNVIKIGKESTESAEIRDRAVLYQRMLEIDFSLLKSVSLNSSLGDELRTNTIEPARLRLLLSHISKLASVYHKLPTEFVVKFEEAPKLVDEEEKALRLNAILSDNLPASGGSTVFNIDLLNLDGNDAPNVGHGTSPTAQDTLSNNTLLDLLGD
jgi:vesicle coat complex subunit